MPFDTLNDLPTRWILGVIAATVIALAAMRARALTPSGAIATLVVGTIVVAGGGWWSGLLLILFFVTSSALSVASKRRRARVAQHKGSQRDHIQVLANGGVAVIAAILALVTGHDSWIVALAASLAAANADTWATEIGRLGGQTPRLITTGRPVPSGTSGGISLAGTIGAFAGALLIGLVAGIGVGIGAISFHGRALEVGVIVTLAGFLGCLGDSLIGATIQATYRDPRSGDLTESPVDPDSGQANMHVRGIVGISNDVVNISAIVIATIIAIILI